MSTPNTPNSTHITLPPPLVVDLPDRSPIGCGYCYERDQVDDCGHRFPHCRTCRCSDCRPMEWRRWRSGGYEIAERVVTFNG